MVADRDRRVFEEFEAAEARGEVTWLSNDEMSAWLDGLIGRNKRPNPDDPPQ